MNSNPYVEARREWDERYADLVLGKRNWQIAAGGLLLSLILGAGVVWQSTRSRFIPYVVEVDKLGYGLTVPKPLIPSADPALVDRMERYEVASFIRNSRSVSSDPSAAMLPSLISAGCFRHVLRVKQPESWHRHLYAAPASFLCCAAFRRQRFHRLRQCRPFSEMQSNPQP